MRRPLIILLAVPFILLCDQSVVGESIGIEPEHDRLGSSHLYKATGHSGTRPSVLVIVTDDQRWDSLWAMPKVKKLLVDKGVTFTEAFVENAVCCPSRASILTGRPSNSTGVYTVKWPHGGFRAFRPHEGSTLATWLNDAGYRTGLFGKYMNEYTEAGMAGHVPPGWDRWVAFAGDKNLYFNYALSVDGSVVSRGARPADYSTDVLAEKAASFIRRTRGPLFVYFAPFAPHWRARGAPRHRELFRDLPPYRPPNFDEADVSDKHRWVQARSRFSPERVRTIDGFRRASLRSLAAVDDAVERLIIELRRTGRLAESLIVYTSDNGKSYGEHRWIRKEVPFEEVIRVPMIVRHDPLVEVPHSDPHLVLNLDLAPTIADVAGIPAPSAEGSSLLPLVRGADVPWRRDFLVEHLKAEGSPVPTYCAVRNLRYKYIRYGEGRSELYDLRKDPFELRNLAQTPGGADVARRMDRRLKELCRPAPPGMRLGAGRGR